MRNGLRARPQMEHRDDLGEGVNGQPEPLHLRMAAKPGAQFVQLQVREPQMAEGPLVQGLGVFPCARQPGGDRGLSKTEDPRGSRKVQPFGQRREHHGDLLRGRFQTVQGRVASRTEGGAAGLTPKGLDRFGLAMFAIAHQRVPMSVSVAEVPALPVRTGEPFGGDAFGSSAPTFHLTPGAYWRRYWSSTQRGRGGASTGGAVVWAARLELTGEPAAHLGCCSRLESTVMRKAVGTQQRQRADAHEDEQVHLVVHEASSWLEMGKRDRFLLCSKNKDCGQGKSSW